MQPTNIQFFWIASFSGKVTFEYSLSLRPNSKYLFFMIIPQENNKEALKQREMIISQVYRDWTKNNPSKCVYNHSLKDYINIRYLSITETIRHAAKTYISTLAMLQLDTILRYSVKYGKPKPPKKGVKNQASFSQMQEMRCNLEGIGTVKMMVGIKRTGEKIQYCITAIRA